MALPRVNTAYDDLLAWLVEKATPAEILAYHVSQATAARAVELMEKNNAGTLAESEIAELEEMRRADKLISLLKARSRAVLSKS